MGCSASRLDILPMKTTAAPAPAPVPKEPPSSSLSSSKTCSLLAPLVHHLPLQKGDTYHLVSLTSSTYGFLLLIDRQPPTSPAAGRDSSDQPRSNGEQIISDSKTPSSPYYVINTWELMEGLDDNDDCEFAFNVDSFFSEKVNPSDSCYFSDAQKPPGSWNRFHSNGSGAKCGDDAFVCIEKPNKEKVEELISCNGKSKSSKPLWKHLSEESLLSKLDPNVASSYLRALSSRQLGYDRSGVVPKTKGSSPPFSSLSRAESHRPGYEDKIVLYFTSLRGIRSTYEDCCAVRMILRGFRVCVDEKDISMDYMYRKELEDALGGKPMKLPQVFIRGKHIGGAEEIKQLNEAGELAKILTGFPVQDCGFTCETCGDVRFELCPSCDGSRKVFVEEEGRIRRCPDCNENGLIRCTACGS